MRLLGPPRYRGRGTARPRMAARRPARRIVSGNPVGASHIVAALRERFGGDPRLVIEDKGAGVALHCRRAPERAAECIAAMREIVTAPDFEILRGHAVVEARPRGAHKGAALNELAAARAVQPAASPCSSATTARTRTAFAPRSCSAGYGVKVGAGAHGGALSPRLGRRPCTRWLAASLAALAPRSDAMTRAASLDLGVTGNCIISALIDREARVVWSCLPRLDGDPVFHALIDDGRR